MPTKYKPVLKAADLASSVPEVYDWTGGYIGLNAGAAWNNSNFEIDNGTVFSLDDDGAAFTGGVSRGSPSSPAPPMTHLQLQELASRYRFRSNA
jgi:opacity protein-like surface antigen